MKYVVGLIIGIILAFGGVAIAYNSQPDIDDAGNDRWIDIGNSSMVKRFVDKDFDLVCWVSDGTYSGGISCVKAK